MLLKVLVVDDEALARRRLVRMLERIPDARLIGEAADGSEALERIRALRPDAVLLDIQMPGLDGLQVAAADEELPAIIFTTAFDDHAVEAFELEAVDYLLKPVDEARLARALERVRRSEREADRAALRRALDRVLSRTPGADSSPPRLTARRGDTTHLIDPRELSRITAANKYAVCTLDGRELVLDRSLAALEGQLASLGFLRVHRSELVNLDRVRSLKSADGALELELDGGERVPVSRRMVGELKRRLGLD